MEITRHEFLKLLGLSAAGASLGAWGANSMLSVPEPVFKRAVSGPRIETWKNSICSLCPGGCGIRVRLIDDIPVRVTGNPLYPINRGAVCPMAEAGVEALFHPERLKRPLKRTGSRGKGKWLPVSWEEALQLLSNRLRQLRERGEPEKLAIVSYDYNDMMTDFIRRFMRAFGSPNFLLSGYEQISSLPSLLTHGWEQPVAYDLINSDLILNFGGNFLDEEPTPIRFNQIYAALRSRKDHPRGRVVHIDSYMSRTAIHSSEWIPISPGTMAAMALAVAHVMIKDRTYDRDFVSRNAFGFSDWQDSAGKWHQGFSSLVDEEYYPQKVAEITKVLAKKIIELARDFAAAKSALAIAGGQAAIGTNSLYTLFAVYCLNALKGNFEKPGGLLFPKDLRRFYPPDASLDETASNGLKKAKVGSGNRSHFSFAVDSPQELALGLEGNDPHLIDTLIFYRANPLFESTNQKQLASALEKVPFIVSCTPFMDETTSFADLILPDHLFLEKWEISRSIPTVEFSHAGVQQPVIAPLYDTRHTGDALLQIAQGLGGSVAAAFPWDSYKSYLQTFAREIFNSGEGTIVSETVERSWIEFLKKRGWQVFDYSTFNEFWEILVEKGGWWDPIYPDSPSNRIFKTQSGRFEFFSRRLQQEVEGMMAAAPITPAGRQELQRRWKTEASGDLLYLPHLELPRFGKEGADYPYHLLSYPLLTTRCGVGANLPLLQELFGMHTREYWNSWVEINPETAKQLGIQDGELVNIISPKGKLRVKAKILPTVMPEVAMIPFGLGHQKHGEQTGSIGVNPHEIFTDDLDGLSGIASLISTRVRLEKVTAA